MSIVVDKRLIHKYNTAGPRYTSYPTAPHFKDVSDDKEYWGQIRKNNITSDKDLSLYFHLPFCDTLCWFCACTSIVTKSRKRIDEYLQFLYREVELTAAGIHPDRKVVQMHFGGGTPTYLTPEQIAGLGTKIKDTFTFADDAEVGCEMDPRDLTEEHIVALREVGFNRASVGVQDFNPKVQAAINRVNSRELIADVFRWLRRHDFTSINVDLVYGLPMQNVKDFAVTLKTILELDPDRFAVFNYAHVPWMKPHQKMIKEGDLPSPDEKIGLLKLIIETLTGAGYRYIGMDHFARENNELSIALKQKKLQRNFQGYSTKAGTDIYAFGMSSISQLEHCYSQNHKKLDTYYRHLAENHLPVEKYLYLSDDDMIRREVIMRFMCDFSIDFQAISEKLGIDFRDYFASELTELRPFAEDSLLTMDKDGFSVTDRGALFIRNIAMTFDAYLKSTSSKNRFSKTV